MNKFLYCILIAATLLSCKTQNSAVLTITDFGIADGGKVKLLTLSFPEKLEAKITNYGGIIVSLSVPDKQGKLEDVVLGYNDLQGYLDKTPYFGALIGRYGNRIAKGKFVLDGQNYYLATNNQANHLHGGLKGFDKVVWNIDRAEVVDDRAEIVLSYLSADGEEGYPGNLQVSVNYTFSSDGVLIEYFAGTDRKTVVNLTQHSYFNLSGNAGQNILDHKLQLNAFHFLPVDSTLIPTGEIREVAGTPFDFTSAKTIGLRIEENNQQLDFGMGYDHCWVLEEGLTKKRRKVASLYHPNSGRHMEVLTVEPAIQFYSGNFLDGSIRGKEGKIYGHRHGLCLETQHFPDSPNQPDFPSVVLNPGERYHTSTEYRFSVR